MTTQTSKFKDIFCSEVEDQIAFLSRTLLELEKDPYNLSHYTELMRRVHTIKGAAATMGYQQMADLAHTLENLFHAGERQATPLDSSSITVALAGVDQLAASLASIKTQDKELDTGTQAKAIEALLSGKPDEKTAGSTTESPQITQAVPHETAPSPTALPRVAVADSVKVGVERLDALMGLFEELLMLRLKLDTMLLPAREAMEEIDNIELRQKFFFIKELQTLNNEMARLLSETQEELLVIRLIPLEQIFGQYPRMVRDLAIREGKRVEFIVRGGDVELDRMVVDGLGGALAHMLRNAVDHGIVDAGTITLAATRVKSRAHIVIEDTGGGINYDRVREVAIARNIGSKEAILAMDIRAVQELLFHPNMSTNAQVTDISGRGIGLFAVRTFIEDVGGRIEIVSPIPELGKGTRFTLDLPVSLATLRVLIVESRGFTFAIPFGSIEKTLNIHARDIANAANQETYNIDEAPVPILRLEKILSLGFGGGFFDTRTEEEILVLLTTDHGRVALLVDHIEGEQELLVKSLPPILRGIKGFSGSTLLPDGRTILLLDIYGLLQHALNDILKHTHPNG